MNLDHLYTILRDTTVQLRKGEVITESAIHPGVGIKVMTIDAMPHQAEITDPGIEKVDCELVVIGVDKAKAQERKAELVDLLKSYPRLDRIAAGPSYIEVGAVIGDQGAAFQLFALGKVLGLWELITPKIMGFEGDEAVEMAGRGFVMISGWRET